MRKIFNFSPSKIELYHCLLRLLSVQEISIVTAFRDRDLPPGFQVSFFCIRIFHNVIFLEVPSHPER